MLKRGRILRKGVCRAPPGVIGGVGVDVAVGLNRKRGRFHPVELSAVVPIAERSDGRCAGVSNVGGIIRLLKGERTSASSIAS